MNDPTRISSSGFDVMVCSCPDGPYLGARKSGTPCCCEACGFLVREQVDHILVQFATSGSDGRPDPGYPLVPGHPLENLRFSSLGGWFWVCGCAATGVASSQGAARVIPPGGTDG